MKLKIGLAHIFSSLFHPLWMPMIGFVLAVIHYNYLVANKATYQGIISILFVNMIIPLLMILLMLKFKMIATIDIKNRKERFVPYLIIIGFYTFSYGLFQYQNIQISKVLYSYFFAIIVVMILGLLINIKWKISVHLLAIGGIIGWLFAFSSLYQIELDYLLIFGILIAGLTASSRLLLDAHTPAQVYSGFVLGFIIQYVIVSERIFITLF